MEQETELFLNDVNRAIIKFRGIYSEWSKKHNISYNEMLVLYTIRENGYCTQKQICENYLLPKQTINHVIVNMLKNGLLRDSLKYNTGRQKAFELSEKGENYARPLLDSISRVEEKAVLSMDKGKLGKMISLICEYDRVLKDALEEDSKTLWKN